MDKPNFHQAFSKLLGQNLKKYTIDNRPLDKQACVGIYQTIYETIISILENAEITITNEAVNFVAQCYYDGILINNTHELDPNIFDKRAKLENIHNKDLVTMLALLDGTDFKLQIIQTLKQRN